MTRFRDRIDAGERLAVEVGKLRGLEDAVVVGIARGGVPVAAGVSRALHAPLDALVVRKIGLPGHEELALGAIVESGVCVLNSDVVAASGIGELELGMIEQRAAADAERLAQHLRQGRPALSLALKAVVVVDDGIATGATARAACLAVRAAGASRVVLAAPVVAAASADRFGEVADQVVFLEAPVDFEAVGLWYHHFGPTPEAQVRQLLAQHGPLSQPSTSSPDRATDPYQRAEGFGSREKLARSTATRPKRGR